MPRRSEPFVINQVYHVFNKTVDNRSLFHDSRLCQVFIKILKYYRSSLATISFSKLRELDSSRLDHVTRTTSRKGSFRVVVLAYCLMPNHFHLLVKQQSPQGIPDYLSHCLNSFTKYFNLNHERQGPLFLPKFKSVSIHADDQLMHVSRYLHLNPYTSELIKNKANLSRYPWSSFFEYCQNPHGRLSDDTLVLSMFGHKRSKYHDFVLSNADYQRTLEEAKHAEKWLLKKR